MATPTVPPPAQDESLEFSPRTKKIITVVVSVILVAIVGGIATFIAVKVLNPPAPAFAAGDCVEVVKGGPYAAEVEKIACGEQAALYEVGLYLDNPDESCPDKVYSSYKQSGGKRQEFRLCLMLNAAEGDCIKVPMISAGQEKKVACASGEANLQVTKVVDGTADKASCDAASVDNARVYPQPKRTVCLGPVAA